MGLALLTAVKDAPNGGSESEKVHRDGKRYDAARGNDEEKF